jgi:ABC-type branched-subunit amino acid transport system substrate-binding protein
MGLFEKLGAKRLGVIHLNDEFGKSVMDLLTTEIPKAGGSLRGEEFAAGDTDFAQRVTALMDTDAILFSGQIPQIRPVVDQIRKSGYTGKVLANSPAADPTVIKLPQIQGIYTAVPIIYKASFLYARELTQKYTARYGKEINTGAAAGYDLVKLVADLLEDQDVSRPNLKARLQKGFVHSGVFGELRLGPGQRDLEIPLYPVQIVDGTIQYQ